MPVAAPSPRGAGGVGVIATANVVSTCMKVCVDASVQCYIVDRRDVQRVEKLLDVIKVREATILDLQSSLTNVGGNVGDKASAAAGKADAASMADVGCQTKRSLKLGVATQCGIIKKDNDSFHQDALLHAERHIAKLEAHLDAMERDTEEFESNVRFERDLARMRFDELLRLRSALAGKARDELGCGQ